MLTTAFRPHRAYSLLEVLLTVSLLGMLLFAIAYAVTHALATTALDVGRNGIARSADELAGRLSSEARSSTAVFVPSSDVYGRPNDDPNGGHEVDFFRKASDGTATFVAYRYDQASGEVDRFEYNPITGGPPNILNQDVVATEVSAFAATFHEASSVPGIVGGANAKPVHIYYGSASWSGGNGIVTVSVTAGASGGLQQHLDVHLASRAAPTDVLVLVAPGSPPPSPSPSSSPILVGFSLHSAHPHGPNHQGGGGDGDPGGGLWGPGIPGTAWFTGNGVGASEDWQSLYSQFNIVQDGTYNFKDSNGNAESVTISCDGSCPPFIPNPIATDGPTVIFHTAN
ncbi:MAG TPA: hypothetical protein VFO25_07370 [Candidatus Eremiobacteraceae bacterium]|nr:hypothetical protein [Candidatus Eremiobacteraceae bacterium]